MLAGILPAPAFGGPWVTNSEAGSKPATGTIARPTGFCPV